MYTWVLARHGISGPVRAREAGGQRPMARRAGLLLFSRCKNSSSRHLVSGRISRTVRAREATRVQRRRPGFPHQVRARARVCRRPPPSAPGALTQWLQVARLHHRSPAPAPKHCTHRQAWRAPLGRAAASIGVLCRRECCPVAGGSVVQWISPRLHRTLGIRSLSSSVLFGLF